MLNEYNFFVPGGSTAENIFRSSHVLKVTYDTRNKFDDQFLNVFVFANDSSFHVT